MRVELAVILSPTEKESYSTDISDAEKCEKCGCTKLHKRPSPKKITEALMHAVEVLFND